MNRKMTKMFLVDVEATGQSSYSGVMTEFGVVELDSGQWFRGQLWDAVPDEKIPAIPVPVKENILYTVGEGKQDLSSGVTTQLATIGELAQAHRDWLNGLSNKAVFVSDNPGYDFERMNVFFDQAGMKNPYGYSSRRIGDIYSGFVKDLRKSSNWTKFRKTEHTHEAHYDSMGNREALLKIIEMMSERNK